MSETRKLEQHPLRFTKKDQLESFDWLNEIVHNYDISRNKLILSIIKDFKNDLSNGNKTIRGLNQSNQPFKEVEKIDGCNS